MFADVEAYERFMGRWSRLVAPRLVDSTGLPERGRMLDVGSGTGSLTFSIAEANGSRQVMGIDRSKEYVAYAISRNPFPDRAGFETGDAQQLRFADASFDASLSLLVFNFIPDPKTALLELRRVTKPGGKISAAVWDYGAGMRMLRTFWDAAVHLDPDAERLTRSTCRFAVLVSWKISGGRVAWRMFTSKPLTSG
jgi:ubiquinone/menaquinone biosynthesis C-methylase UbiE